MSDGGLTDEEAIDAAEDRIPRDVAQLLVTLLDDDDIEGFGYLDQVKDVLRKRDLLPPEISKDELIGSLQRENASLRSTLEAVRRESDTIKKNASQVGAQVNTQHAKIKLLNAELREAQLTIANLQDQVAGREEEQESRDANSTG